MLHNAQLARTLRSLSLGCAYRRATLVRSLPGLTYRYASSTADASDSPAIKPKRRRARKSKPETEELPQKPEEAGKLIKPGKYESRKAMPIPPEMDKTTLPPFSEWRKYFPITGEAAKRFCVSNPETAKLLAEAFVPEGSRGKIIIEAAPGPGQLTRALLNLPKERIAKLIVLETAPSHLEFLRPLQEKDPRLHVFDLHGKDWDTYTHLTAAGMFDDVKTIPWEAGIHPQLQFIMHLGMAVHGEQLLAQLVRAIPDSQWLFKYGRMPMNILLMDRMWDRIKAQPGHVNRCKVSVMAQAAAEFSESVPASLLQPFSDHFHPPLHKEEQRNPFLLTRRLGNPISAVTVIPLAEQLIKPGDLDYWDFCVRKLFVQKATSIKKSVSSLGPGAAQQMMPRLTDPSLPPEQRLAPEHMPRDFALRDWALVIEAFKSWPFRPEDLGIETFFETSSSRR